MKIIADTNVLVSVRIVPVGKPAAIFRQIALFEHVTSSLLSSVAQRETA